ncbi:MAG: hypothetical protein ABI359_00895 [Ginsengibacter sp.]
MKPHTVNKQFPPILILQSLMVREHISQRRSGSASNYIPTSVFCKLKDMSCTCRLHYFYYWNIPG